MDSITSAQLGSLDDTDCYASAWSDALQLSTLGDKSEVSWGGRGQGGRRMGRRTTQPHDIVVENVRLEYVHDSATELPGKILLDAAKLKLLSPRVYSLVGRNGCGKSTLLRRIAAGKIPGFPPHISTFYVPQEVMCPGSKTPIELVLGHHDTFKQHSAITIQTRIEELEEKLESIDVTIQDNSETVEEICEQICSLEDERDGGYDTTAIRHQVEESLSFFELDESWWNVPSENLSGGQRKKVLLACALFCRSDLLLLDEPTNHLDISGLVQLRRLLAMCSSKDRNTTVLLVSHDVDLVNDVSTDVIHFSDELLGYYPGNYSDFVGYKNQKETRLMRQSHSLEKRRDQLMHNIDNMKKQNAGRKGVGKKKGAKSIESHKKKLEKCGIEKDEKGHRWTQQKACTGIKEGSINSVDASTRSKLSSSQLLKRAEISIAPIPDKAVQFVFRNPSCTWGEPLIMAMDVGYYYDAAEDSAVSPPPRVSLFDCVDLCIDEQSNTCLIGTNGSGKSTLLRILAKMEEPREGTIHHALNVSVGYLDQHACDKIIDTNASAPNSGISISISSSSSSSLRVGATTIKTPLSYLTERHPNKADQDLRGELAAFGLSPAQASTNVRFLSGGERCRLCLADLMLGDPQVLIMDEPTSHLDVESVDALIYGLKQWKGTLLIVSHDSHFIRQIGGNCYVLMPEESKLRRVPGGIDSYLKAFT